MGKLVMIILTKSSKFSAKCVAGINVENGEWVRLVSDDVEKHGAIPDYKLQTDTREISKSEKFNYPTGSNTGAKKENKGMFFLSW